MNAAKPDRPRRFQFSTRAKIAFMLALGMGLLSLATTYMAIHGVGSSIIANMQDDNRVLLQTLAMNLRERRFDLDSMNALNDRMALRYSVFLENQIRSLESRDDFVALAESIYLDSQLSLWLQDENFRPVVQRGGLKTNPTELSDREGKRLEPALRELRQKGGAGNLQVETAKGGKEGKGYIGHCFYLPERRLLASIWVESVERDRAFAANQRAFVERIRENTKSYRIGETGFIFVVGTDGGLMVTGPWDIEPLLAEVNPDSGRPLGEDIRAYASHADKVERALEADIETPGGRRRALFLAEFMPSFEWLVVCVMFPGELTAPLWRRVWYPILTTFFLTGLLLALIHWLAGKVMAPLADLAGLARETPGTDFLGLPDPGREKRMRALASGHMGGEVEELAQAFMFMDASLRKRVRELVDTAGARERLAGELHGAREIQAGMLPPPLNDLAGRGRFAVAGCLEPALEVGGDLYDYFLLDENRLCLVIGDVSGKGVPAALFMAMAMVLIRAGASETGSPAVLMRHVNVNLAANNPQGLFVTLFVAYLDLRDGRVEYASAGHNPPVVRGRNGLTELDGEAGLVCGFFEEAEFASGQLTLQPGDALFLYTDGVTEAMDRDKKRWGAAAMRETLSGTAGAGPEATLQAVREGVRGHVGTAAASDDLTMVCCVYIDRPENSCALQIQDGNPVAAW